jgi:D-alanyl-D-alanine carboxypeptidase (penicillin-binding protein 5/6)
MLLPFLLSPFAGAALYDSEKIFSPYAAVYNVENGIFIFEKNADEFISATVAAKLMTAIIAIEHYAGDLSAEITVTTESIKNVDKAVAGFRVGDSVSIKDLLYASLIGNCTYSASVIAYAVSGNQAAFGKLMNAKAAELGMKNTSFASATSYGADIEHYHTTVRDSALLSAYAMKDPIIAKIVNTTSYTFESFTSSLNQTIRTKNAYFSSWVYGDKYLWTNKDIYPDGISFTYSADSGYSLISSVNHRSLTYICVCSGAFEDDQDKIAAYDDVKKLLIWASKEYTTVKILDKAQIFGEIPVKLSNEENFVVVVPEKSLYAFLPCDTDVSAEISQVYEITVSQLEAPVEKGASVGKITLYHHGKAIASCALVTKSNIEKSDALAFRQAFFSKNMLIGTVVSLFAASLFGIIRFYVFLKISKTHPSDRGTNKENNIF